MALATVSSKGQITLPVEARRSLGIEAGDRVLIAVRGNQIVIEPVVDFLTLRGVLGAALSPEEEDEAMRAVAAGAPQPE